MKHIGKISHGLNIVTNETQKKTHKNHTYYRAVVYINNSINCLLFLYKYGIIHFFTISSVNFYGL